MSKPGRPPLPQELFDNVIDHFYDDATNLKSCSLVCRAWLPSCRTHIFHRVSLTPPTPAHLTKSRNTARARFSTTTPSACAQLFDLIADAPAIVPFIRELRLCEGMATREWIAYDPALPRLLHVLTNLRRFEFERSASMRIAWCELSTQLRSGLKHIFALPSLMELKLVGLVMERPAELHRVLRTCTNLRTLQADHVMFSDEDESGELQFDTNIRNDPSVRAPLDVLVIGPRTSTALIDCLLHPESSIDVTSIRRLSISISGDFAAFARLLRAAHSINFLEIVLMNDIDLQAYWILPPSDQFDLSHNPHIETLELKIDVIQRQDDPLPWLCALFRSYTPHPSLPSALSPTNALTDIWIVYTLYLPAPYMDRSVNTTIFSGWREIDAVLTGEGYAVLKRVRLDFMLENPIGFGVAPRFLGEVSLQSPILEARGMLIVDAFDTSG